MKAMRAATSPADLPDQPHREALRTLAHGLCRWAMSGLNERNSRNSDPSDDHPIVAALDRTETALYLPHDDVAASEIACLAALQGLVDAFGVVFTETQLLTPREVAVLWNAVAYIDAFDEEAERQERQERLSREDMAQACFAEAQRERTRGQRNRQRQRCEERTDQTQRSQRTAVAA